MICRPCQVVHQRQDCVDELADPPRVYPHRHCYCQHAPRRDVSPSTDPVNGEGQSWGRTGS